MHTVTITSQGQITIPAKIRRQLGFHKTNKALVFPEDGRVIIEPIKDLLELGGSLKTSIQVNPKRQREAFAQYLGQRALKGIPKQALRKLGFRQISPNIFYPLKIKINRIKHT